jgi:hypothetical protein
MAMARDRYPLLTPQPTVKVLGSHGRPRDAPSRLRGYLVPMYCNGPTGDGFCATVNLHTTTRDDPADHSVPSHPKVGRRVFLERDWNYFPRIGRNTPRQNFQRESLWVSLSWSLSGVKQT